MSLFVFFNRANLFAEASCRSAIRTAKDIVADFGEAAASKSVGVVELAKRKLENSEMDCHRLMAKKHRLSLPVDKDYLDTKAKNKSLRIPFLRFRNWMKFVLENNCMHIFSGLVKPDRKREGDIWEAFWQRYEKQHRSHPIYQLARDGKVKLRNCVGVLLHGDEGRSRKRQAFLLLNLHSPLGRGVEVGLQRATKREYLKMLPNFVGHSYTNRFLVSAIPKAQYTGENSFVFDLLLDKVAEELCHMSSVGVQQDGETYHAFCLGGVGDWPWLVKSGNLQRSFMNVEKHKEEHGAGQRQRQDCRGICHLCQAGQPGWPYEQIGSRHPTWEASICAESPFDGQNPLEAIPHPVDEFPFFYHFDLFHCWHLGMAKHYLGSMLALLSGLEDGGNIDLRFNQLTDKYLRWCSENGRTAHCLRIMKEHIQRISTSHYPQGTWHKGDLSTSLMLWVEARYLSENWQDETLALAGQAAVAINGCIRLLYSGGAWLSPNEARECGDLGLRFLRRYNRLACMAFQEQKRFWLVMPKAHALHHIFLGLVKGSELGPTLSPIVTSVQQDEDFIGRGSRLSRHVSQAQCSERVVDRYLQATFPQYMQCGLLVSIRED